MILIIDFGSQTAHLIGRRIKSYGVAVEIVIPKNALHAIQKNKPNGIILSGGPASVYEKEAPTIDKKIFQLGIPILGICYGWQLTAHLLGGKVVQGHREYGPTKVGIHTTTPLFENVKAKHLTVWMSHGDEVVELPVGFDYHVSTPTVKAAGVGDFERKIFGVQFHPEVEHTQEGKRILRNFVENICGLAVQERRIDVSDIIEKIRTIVAKHGSDGRAIAAVSGGVDSTVACAIIAKAIGQRFTPIYCDNGLMRVGTTEEVIHIFQNIVKVKPIILRCQNLFLMKLKGVIDPEKKRIAIGNLYI